MIDHTMQTCTASSITYNKAIMGLASVSCFSLIKTPDAIRFLIQYLNYDLYVSKISPQEGASNLQRVATNDKQPSS